MPGAQPHEDVAEGERSCRNPPDRRKLMQWSGLCLDDSRSLRLCRRRLDNLKLRKIKLAHLEKPCSERSRAQTSLSDLKNGDRLIPRHIQPSRCDSVLPGRYVGAPPKCADVMTDFDRSRRYRKGAPYSRLRFQFPASCKWQCAPI